MTYSYRLPVIVCLFLLFLSPAVYMIFARAGSFMFCCYNCTILLRILSLTRLIAAVIRPFTAIIRPPTAAIRLLTAAIRPHCCHTTSHCCHTTSTVVIPFPLLPYHPLLSFHHPKISQIPLFAHLGNYSLSTSNAVFCSSKCSRSHHLRFHCIHSGGPLRIWSKLRTKRFSDLDPWSSRRCSYTRCAKVLSNLL